jgi:hypothetical protein
MFSSRQTATADTAAPCPTCAAAWSVASDAQTKQRAAEADAARARESERRAYGTALRALDQGEAARRELDRMHALFDATGQLRERKVRR